MLGRHRLIHCGDAVSMMTKERLPTLRRWFSSFDYIFGDYIFGYLAPLVCPTSMPSLSNSPWIRGAPHSGLAMRQYDLKPARCHFMTVSGFTIANAFRTVDENRY